MKLRILTPTLGSSPHWAAAVGSIAAAAPDAEHIVICPAGGLLSNRAFAEGVRVIADEGNGLYAALNLGLRAPGDWDAFTWLNDDDMLAEGFSGAWSDFHARPEAGAIYGRVGLIDGQGGALGRLPVASTPGDLRALLVRGIMPLAQPGTIVRRNVVDSIGAFDESYRLAGDLDFFARALIAGVRFSFCSRTVAQFRLHSGQLSKQEVVAAEEFERVVSPLRRARVGGGLAALVRFRWANRGAYWDRWRRHGGVSMRELYRRT